MAYHTSYYSNYVKRKFSMFSFNVVLWNYGIRAEDGRGYTPSPSELVELDELAAMEEASSTPMRNIDNVPDVLDDNYTPGESRVGSRGPILRTTCTNTPERNVRGGYVT